MCAPLPLPVKMNKAWYDIGRPAGYSGVRALSRAAGVPERQARQFLERQPLYRQFKRPKRIVRRAQIRVPSLGDTFFGDLFDLQKLKWHNSNYGWLVLIVDGFSRMLYCRPSKTKSGQHVRQAVDDIFAEIKGRGLLAPMQAWLGVDLGTEWWNDLVTHLLLDKYNVRMFALRAPKKSAMAELMGRHLLRRLYKYMADRGTKRWIDVLAVATNGMNTAHMDSIGCAPAEVTFDSQRAVYERLYPAAEPAVAFKYDVADRVRVARERGLFSKERHGGWWSDEVFRIRARHPHAIPRYSLSALDGTPISGTFYAEELQRDD